MPVARGWPWSPRALGRRRHNISVHTPLFRTIGPASSAVTVAVFALLVAVWCVVASWLGSHRKIIELVDRSGRWLVPVVFVIVGVVIVPESIFR
ncbi:cadmium resistance transporter [Streptosporangium sp. NPDC006013]|uniref:cadmium resistance transporter n=1 Tax=Streptosporangium sp. NPDC006013 TaxID=3155596 RepID=UPI00339E2D98